MFGLALLSLILGLCNLPHGVEIQAPIAGSTAAWEIPRFKESGNGSWILWECTEDINRKVGKDQSAAGAGRGFTWRFEQPLSHGWSPPQSKLMPASATLGQIPLNPPGLTPSHSAAPVSSTSDPGSAVLGAPDRCQGPLTLTRCYHIHQVDQRSDLSQICQSRGCRRCRGCMLTWWKRASETQHNSKSHTHLHTSKEKKNLFEPVSGGENTFDGVVRGDQFKKEEHHHSPFVEVFHPHLKEKEARFHNKTTGPTLDACLWLFLRGKCHFILLNCV